MPSPGLWSGQKVQAPTILTEQGIPVTLIGKVADIVANDCGTSISCVPTGECMEHTIREFEKMQTGFICTNVQETDLAGHSTVIRCLQGDPGVCR